MVAMAKATASIPAIVWCETAQVALVQRVAELAGLFFAGAGSPARGQSGAVAGELNCRAMDDLRHVLATAPGEGVKLLWIMSPGGFGTDSSEADAAAVQSASAAGLTIAASEPVPASALELAAGGWAPETGPARPCDALQFVPRMRNAKALREAGEVFASLGPIRLATVEHWGTPESGSAGAALFSTLELLHALMGEPETIDAAYVGPTHIQGLHALPGETLRDLHGDIAANLRFSDGRAASVTLSSHAGRWDRRAVFVGGSSRLVFARDGFELIGADGAKLDEMKAPKTPPDAAAAVAEALLRMVDPANPNAAPIDVPAALSIAQAALLSARTGQPESPATVRRMAGMGA